MQRPGSVIHFVFPGSGFDRFSVPTTLQPPSQIKRTPRLWSKARDSCTFKRAEFEVTDSECVCASTDGSWRGRS